MDTTPQQAVRHLREEEPSLASIYELADHLVEGWPMIEGRREISPEVLEALKTMCTDSHWVGGGDFLLGIAVGVRAGSDLQNRDRALGSNCVALLIKRLVDEVLTGLERVKRGESP